jgi:hypothetical protein
MEQPSMTAGNRQFARLWLVVAVIICGCGSKASQRPAEQWLISTRRGAAAYVAQGRGTLHIIDSRTGATVYRVELDSGQKVMFLPERNQIWLDGTPAAHEPLEADRVYRMYFVRSQ